MRRGNHSKSRASKGLVLMLALVLVFGVAVGGTIAWLTAQTDTVTNTFTTSNITVTIAETEGTNGTGEGINKSFKMIPGHTIKKDPKVTVATGSEECWLFVKLEKSNNFDTYLTYQPADGWTALDGVSGVYSRHVKAENMGTPISVLEGDEITVKGSVTADQMTNAKTDVPTLKVTAYACQYMKNGDENFTAAQAWDAITNPNP